MEELWQLYDKDGNPIPGKGAGRDAVYKGLLHGAAHVWIWRKTKNSIEILVQRRAADKRTWPNMLDISAAGHIDLGEQPIEAAVRETKEELGLDIKASDLSLVKIHRTRTIAPGGSIENELKWMYVYELKNEASFSLQEDEVSSLQWVDFTKFQQQVYDETKYVKQGSGYFESLISYLKQKV